MSTPHPPLLSLSLPLSPSLSPSLSLSLSLSLSRSCYAQPCTHPTCPSRPRSRMHILYVYTARCIFVGSAEPPCSVFTLSVTQMQLCIAHNFILTCIFFAVLDISSYKTTNNCIIKTPELCVYTLYAQVSYGLV